MLSNFFTTTFEVRRSQWLEDEDNNPYSEEVIVGNFNGHIQQAGAELVQHLGLSLTKAFTVWCHVGTDVLEGDTIETTEDMYSVRAIQKQNVGNNKHLELIVELDQVEGS